MNVQVFYPGDDTSGWDLSRPAWFVAPLPEKRRRPPTAAGDRTRSARWRAGSRRARRLALRRGPSPVSRDPWAGWQDMGWVEEDWDE